MSTRNITVRGRRTSVALDDAFWGALEEIAAARGVPAAQLCTAISEAAGPGRIAAGLRVFVVETLAAASRD